MKQRPILFSAPMVRAILDGRKTQTRRLVSPQPLPPVHRWECIDGHWHARGVTPGVARQYCTTWPDPVGCPYGVVGDRLWVREEHYRFGHWEPVPGVRTPGGRQKWKFVGDTNEVLFEAPRAFRNGCHQKDPATSAWHKRLARFMPRWASRITLEVTGVRVEQLQGLSEADALAEGFLYMTNPYGRFYRAVESDAWDDDPRDAFRRIWERVNYKREGAAWASNPLVWVVGFRVLEAKP